VSVYLVDLQRKPKSRCREKLTRDNHVRTKSSIQLGRAASENVLAIVLKRRHPGSVCRRMGAAELESLVEFCGVDS
jgi:hypothetical protein